MSARSGAPTRPRSRQLLKGLSDQSRWLRFFSGFPNLEKAVQWATEVDYERRYGLVATTGTDGRVVGHAGFERQPDHPERAEVALEIADLMQGRGLGTILLGQLAEAANEIGVQLLDAEVLPQNHQMIKVFRDSGFPVKTQTIPGVILIEFPTSLSPEALGRFERRDQAAATAAMDAFWGPRSVAVIGASRRRGTVAGELFHNLLAAGFNGPVYPVNPKAPVVQSVLAYKSVLDVPGPVDLAGLRVPAPAVAQAARDCAAKGVRAVVVISAGFAETGPEGVERQRELLAVCRAAGMRLIGPNCLGILNTDPQVGLDATFGPIVPLGGRVGFLSQSGALGLANRLCQRARAGVVEVRLGGQQGRHSGNDLLAYWEQDPRTGVVLLYLESFGNPRKFGRVARGVARSKPVVAVKCGRSAAGARATSSHTGACWRLGRHRGRLVSAGRGSAPRRWPSVDVASLFVNQPVPAGRRVGIVTNVVGGSCVRMPARPSGSRWPSSERPRPRSARACPPRRRGESRRHAGGRRRALPTDGRSRGGHLRGGRRRHRDLHPAPAQRPGGGGAGDPRRRRRRDRSRC